MLLQIDLKAKIMVLYDPTDETDKFMTVPINNASVVALNKLLNKGLLKVTEYHCLIKEDYIVFEYTIVHVGAVLALAYSVGLNNITLGKND